MSSVYTFNDKYRNYNDICANHSNVDFYIISLSHTHPIAGFTVDVTSYADEWSRGVLRLDNQTRSNADTSAVVRTDVSRSFRRRLLSIAGYGWHSETTTKAYVWRCNGRSSIYIRSLTTV